MPHATLITRFDVVIPSLPGFFLSTLPQREGWTIVDTARVFHKLMTEVLGYKKYAGQGGDWVRWPGSHSFYRAVIYLNRTGLVHFEDHWEPLP